MNGTATRRSQATSVTNAEHAFERAPEMWKPGAKTLPGRAKATRNHSSLARQSAYVAMDFVLVCAGGAGVFWLRFDLANPFSLTEIVPVNLLQQVLSASYPGFLLLYAGLVVLACMSQDLYRTARERSAWEESASVVKAVGFATALLVLFIFTSGNKEISRLVVICSEA